MLDSGQDGTTKFGRARRPDVPQPESEKCCAAGNRAIPMEKFDMIDSAKTRDFVSIVAREISTGIDRALAYWLGRIEVELVDRNITTAQREAAIEAILREYKRSLSRDELGMASA
jgi:hypothetical protein